MKRRSLGWHEKGVTPAPGGPPCRHRGAALVEAALVTPLLLMLVLGVIEYALVFSDQSTVVSATRTGARAAVAYSKQAGYDQQAVDASVSALTARTTGTPLEMWIYRVDEAEPGKSKGAPKNNPNFQNCTVDCRKYTWNTTTKTWTYDTSGPDWPATNMNACTLPLDQLAVRIRFRHDMVTGLFGASLTLTDRTVMRLEPQPLSVCP